MERFRILGWPFDRVFQTGRHKQKYSRQARQEASPGIWTHFLPGLPGVQISRPINASQSEIPCQKATQNPKFLYYGGLREQK